MKLTKTISFLVLVLLISSIKAKAQEINMDDLKTKFFKLCDVAVERYKIPDQAPLRYASRDQDQSKPGKISFYVSSYPVRALAVAYDLTGKEEYLNTMREWADRVLMFQEKMIPKNAYYMNYGRGPYEEKGGRYNADCSEIAMGVLTIAVRCKNPIEKKRYLKSVEAYVDMVLDHYVGPNGGITNGQWPEFDGEWWASTAYTGPLLFKLYEETGNQRYLDAAIKTAYWFVNLESLRKKSKDSLFIKLNAPNEGNPYPTKPRQSAGGILNQLHLYNAGSEYIFSEKYPGLKNSALKEIDFFEKWCKENLLGKGESSRFEKTGYDIRKLNGATFVGGKFGAIPLQMYGLARKGIFSPDMVKVADKELQRIVNQIFAHNDLLITEFVGFAMVSMAEKISPGGILRNSSTPIKK